MQVTSWPHHLRWVFVMFYEMNVQAQSNLHFLARPVGTGQSAPKPQPSCLNLLFIHITETHTPFSRQRSRSSRSSWTRVTMVPRTFKAMTTNKSHKVCTAGNMCLAVTPECHALAEPPRCWFMFVLCFRCFRWLTPNPANRWDDLRKEVFGALV